MWESISNFHDNRWFWCCGIYNLHNSHVVNVKKNLSWQIAVFTVSELSALERVLERSSLELCLACKIYAKSPCFSPALSVNSCKVSLLPFIITEIPLKDWENVSQTCRSAFISAVTGVWWCGLVRPIVASVRRKRPNQELWLYMQNSIALVMFEVV